MDKFTTWNALCAMTDIARTQAQEIDRLCTENAELQRQICAKRDAATVQDIEDIFKSLYKASGIDFVRIARRLTGSGVVDLNDLYKKYRH
jgi:hypothetical protein